MMAVLGCPKAPFGILLRKSQLSHQHSLNLLRLRVPRPVLRCPHVSSRCQHTNGASAEAQRNQEAYTVTTPLYYVNAGAHLTVLTDSVSMAPLSIYMRHVQVPTWVVRTPQLQQMLRLASRQAFLFELATVPCLLMAQLSQNFGDLTASARQACQIHHWN